MMALNLAHCEGDLTLVQTLPLGSKIPLSLALTSLPHSQGRQDWYATIVYTYRTIALLLAIGSTDRKLQLWARSETTVGTVF
jgi:hypothetical protein